MSVGARHGPGEAGTSVWRRPRWPDGRLISPLDDGIPHWVRVLAIAPLFVWIWVLGQTAFPVPVTVPHAPMVLVSLLFAIACCWLESNRRFRELADASPPPAGGEAPRFDAATATQTLWPAARWPDGRHVGGDDRIAEALKWLGVSLGVAASWVFGSVYVAGADAGDWWTNMEWLLTVPVGILGFVSNSRIRALAENAASEGPEGRASPE